MPHNSISATPSLARTARPDDRTDRHGSGRGLGHCVNIIYSLVLALWFGGLMMTGLVAAMIFPTMRELGVQLDQFAAFDPTQHWKIAAGAVMEKVFFALDLVQGASVLIIVMLFILQITLLGHRLRSKINLLRGLLIVVLLCTTAWHVLVLAPRMNSNLRQFWTLAESGGVDATGHDAAHYQAAFDADHPTASTSLSTNAILVAGLVGVSAIALGRPRGQHAKTPGDSD